MNPVPGFIPKIKILDQYHYDALLEETELMWRCLNCGELMHRKDGLPEHCPSCGASKKEFVLVDED